MITVSARERILSTATRLFYEHGIHRVGIDLVIAESGVAKMSLYRQFGSKEELVLAFLDRINTEWFTWLSGRVASARAPQRPLAVFDALGEWFKTPTFRGSGRSGSPGSVALQERAARLLPDAAP